MTGAGVRSTVGRAAWAAVVAALLAAGLLGLLPRVAARAATVAVEVTDDGFAPTVVTALVGDTVQWTWTGQGQHGVRADTGEFDSHPSCTGLAPVQCGGPGAAYSWLVSGSPRTVGYTDPVTGAAGRIVVTEPEPTPTASASPSPSASPTPSASASPSPEPTTGPTPSPTPTRTFGPPPPRTTAPPVVVSPTATATVTETASEAAAPPRSDVSLEPFPSAASPLADLADVTPTTVAGAVVLPGSDDPLRATALVVAAVTLTVTLVAFGRLVLFGPPW